MVFGDTELAQMFNDAARGALPNREKLRRRAANGSMNVPDGESRDDGLAKLLSENSDENFHAGPSAPRPDYLLPGPRKRPRNASRH